MTHEGSIFPSPFSPSLIDFFSSVCDEESSFIDCHHFSLSGLVMFAFGILPVPFLFPGFSCFFCVLPRVLGLSLRQPRGGMSRSTSEKVVVLLSFMESLLGFLYI